MMQIYGPHIVFGWFGILVWIFFFFAQSKPSADNDKHEGEIKKITHTQTKKWGFAGQKQKHRSKTRQHKAESQGKAQISIKSLKWVHKQQTIKTN